MRIVTRADLDGIVCALLLLEKEKVTEPIFWVEPSEMQKMQIDIQPNDIIANLPFHPNCAMWFDHHVTNQPEVPFKGLFDIAPSAAGLIYTYYKKDFKIDYDELVEQTDRIDSADLTLEEVNQPELNPYLLLSMTFSSRNKEDEPYWNYIVELLRRKPIKEVLEDSEVKRRCNEVVKQNNLYSSVLKEHTSIDSNVSITDFTPLKRSPKGNRFLVYSLFPDVNVSVKIVKHPTDPSRMIISLGHSIFNKTCRVNVGYLLSEFEGGGHHGAGSCNFPNEKKEEVLNLLLTALKKNEVNEK